MTVNRMVAGSNPARGASQINHLAEISKILKTPRVCAVSAKFIPDRFKLIIQSDGLNRSCHIVWRKERRMGIAFD
jgi:hypothetical protein